MANEGMGRNVQASLLQSLARAAKRMSVSRAADAGNSIVFMAAITGLYTEALSCQLSALSPLRVARSPGPNRNDWLIADS